jgi:hypothetical protein
MARKTGSNEPLNIAPGRTPQTAVIAMLVKDEIETVDAEPMLALDTPLAGLPPELPAQLAGELAELIEDAERHAAAAQAINTTRAYASDWKQFAAWCERYRVEPLPAPAAVVGLYLTSLAKRGLAVSTIRRRAAAIARAHRSSSTPNRPDRAPYEPSAPGSTPPRSPPDRSSGASPALARSQAPSPPKPSR